MCDGLGAKVSIHTAFSRRLAVAATEADVAETVSKLSFCPAKHFGL